MRLMEFQRRFNYEIYDNPAGTTRAHLSSARKNGKSALIAAIALAHIVGPEAKQNSQIVSGARSRDLASLVYTLAEKMVRLNPKLRKLVKPIPNQKTLIEGAAARVLQVLCLSGWLSGQHRRGPGSSQQAQVRQGRVHRADRWHRRDDHSAADALLAQVRASFRVEPSAAAVQPAEPETFGMLVADRWYRLSIRPELVPRADPVASPDVSLLQEHLLAPILGIGDPRIESGSTPSAACAESWTSSSACAKGARRDRVRAAPDAHGKVGGNVYPITWQNSAAPAAVCGPLLRRR
jgi:hypothetical protein